MEKRESAITKRRQRDGKKFPFFIFFLFLFFFRRDSDLTSCFSRDVFLSHKRGRRKPSSCFYFGGPRKGKLNRKCFERCLLFWGEASFVAYFWVFFSAGRSLFARGQGGGEVLKDISNVFREGERYGKAGQVRKISLCFFKKKLWWSNFSQLLETRFFKTSSVWTWTPCILEPRTYVGQSGVRARSIFCLGDWKSSLFFLHPS